MAFDRVRSPKISDAIVRQLESLILEGTLKPGERLPPERDLAHRLEVSRPSLREALQKLETLGLVETRQGGGTYVGAVLAPTLTDPLVHLFQRHPETVYDLLEFRQALEGIAAYYAAIRATDADRRILERRFGAMEEAHRRADPVAEAGADAALHLSVAEAAHNVVLLHIMRGLFDLLRRGIVSSRERLYTREGVREVLLRQHRGLYEALVAGDAEAARTAAHDHLVFVEGTLREIDREEGRRLRSERRLRTLEGGGE
ncbi:MAG: FCD domain-containing protein [Deferrisomatales bacterium]|nr:FCD domain-containing protein [Deferrisomatales bacterium]